jgi:hypothetical protein
MKNGSGRERLMTARVVAHWSAMPRGAWEAAKILVLLLVMLLVFAALFLPLLPNWNGAVGLDYSYYFPSLLAGYYWRLENGVFSIPWFSPSQCGGIPYFADPSAAYFSVPQFLVFLISPLAAVRATFLVFAATGFVGMYLLTRVAFRSSVPAGALAACLFMFNGFYVYRMLIGHLTFHAFALVPIVAVVLLPAPGGDLIPWQGKVLRIGVAALSLAYMFHSGMVEGLPPALLALAIILLLHAYLFGWRRFPFAALTVAGLFSLLISAGKLAASFAFFTHFPRNGYKLPGIPGVWLDFALAFRTVFFAVPDDVQHALTNVQVIVGRHEWEYGVSPAPLVFMAAASVAALWRRSHNPALPLSSPQRLCALLAAIVLMLVPLALNYYQPGWNAFLKSVPFIGSNSNLIRWFCAYIPVAILGGALALDRIPIPGIPGECGRASLATVGVLVMLASNMLTDRGYYGPEEGFGYYSVSNIQNAYEAAATTKAPRAIIGITDIRDPGGIIEFGAGRSDALAFGMSQGFCYQPIFGYQLEYFPFKRLHPGLALEPFQGFLNVKNPACFIFPRENDCEPGDHFRVSEIDSAIAFLHYKPFEFRKPLYADLANWISLITLLVVLSGMAGAAILRGKPSGFCAPSESRDT